MEPGFRLLAMSVDAIHLSAMLLWGLGLPLLVWHGRPALSRLYMCYAVGFVIVSVVSRQLLGECFLTTLARSLWAAAGAARGSAPFTSIAVNAVASVVPSNRTVIILWEASVLLTCLGSLWCWLRTHSRRSGARRDIALH
jgi:hypothetical protein